MTAASAPRLPPELTDLAIDHLHHDVAALRALARVARSTLPAARYHLFHGASVHCAADVDKLQSLVQRSPHLAPYIHSLTVSKATRHPPPAAVDSSSSAWEATLAASALPHQLPHLTSLHLHRFLSFWQPASFSVLSYAAFASVHALHISDSSLRSFTELRLLLAALPGLRSLVLDGVGIGIGTGTTPADLPSLSAAKDAHGTQLLVDGTRTPPHLRLHALSLFQDPVALTALRVSHRSAAADACSPALSVGALTVLLNYLLTTPSVFALRVDHVAFDRFDGLGDDADAVVKGFRDALVRARRARADDV